MVIVMSSALAAGFPPNGNHYPCIWYGVTRKRVVFWHLKNRVYGCKYMVQYSKRSCYYQISLKPSVIERPSAETTTSPRSSPPKLEASPPFNFDPSTAEHTP
jgi:hypothetical protein